jgi:WD40 repeat protein
VRPLDGGPDWTMLVPADLPTWIGFSSDEQYAFYSVSTNELRAERRTRLYSVPAPDGAGGPRVSAVTPLLEHLVPAPGWLRDIALSRDGRRALALSSDGTVRTWDVDTAASLEGLAPADVHHRLRTLTAACLAPEERATLLGENARTANEAYTRCVVDTTGAPPAAAVQSGGTPNSKPPERRPPNAMPPDQMD